MISRQVESVVPKPSWPAEDSSEIPTWRALIRLINYDQSKQHKTIIMLTYEELRTLNDQIGIFGVSPGI